MSVEIAQLSAEHHESGFGLDTPSPRLSWRFKATEIDGWVQTGYEIGVKRGGEETVYKVDSSQSALVPWPTSPLLPREVVEVRVRAIGEVPTSWASITLEASLFDQPWEASMITGPQQQADLPKRPVRFQQTFTVPSFHRARLYATAFGIYEVEINGRPVGDQVLAPGWTSYHHHLNYQTYDLGGYLKEGKNTITAQVAEGWYAGRLGREHRNVWGERPGFMGQVEVDGKVVVVSDDSWELLGSNILESEIYNGEVVDTSAVPQILGQATILPPPTAKLISSHAPPVRRIMEIKPVELITTPSGRKVLDFGQNLVGWLRINRDLPGSGELVLRHAEVMENGELGVRPLRTAMARDIIKLGGKTKGWEPKFTFHGFRYAEITYEGSFTADDFTAIVISSDMRRTGHFTCSHEMISKLHENVVWGMRGNFVSIPTDCPQRDERLGWTGDIQVFAPTANFLFDTQSFLGGWLKDVAVEQEENNGVPPIFVPWTPPNPNIVNPHNGSKPRPQGVWADVVAHTPWDLFMAYGDKQVLEDQFESMLLWLEKGVLRAENGLWSRVQAQYGDWLDPKAPPQYPAHGRTDYLLPADAYLVYTTGLVAKIAGIIGRPEAAKYHADHLRLLALFRDEYITKNGRIASDTQTALTLALWFDLVEEHQREHTVDRLEWLIKWEFFKVSTGFAGTPLILPNLARHGALHLAYRMLQERDNPSWLYSVGMGATTIWERWDSMLPDGAINPGQMTSFNHYALGSVAAFLHRTVGGLAPREPGWKSAIIQPQPGGTVTSANTSFDSPYGPYSVVWSLNGEDMAVKISVPPNATAQVILPGVDDVVGSGKREYAVKWARDERWPPRGVDGPQRIEMPDNFVA